MLSSAVLAWSKSLCKPEMTRPEPDWADAADLERRSCAARDEPKKGFDELVEGRAAPLVLALALGRPLGSSAGGERARSAAAAAAAVAGAGTASVSTSTSTSSWSAPARATAPDEPGEPSLLSRARVMATEPVPSGGRPGVRGEVDEGGKCAVRGEVAEAEALELDRWRVGASEGLEAARSEREDLRRAA